MHEERESGGTRLCTGIHGNEDATGGTQLDLSTLKHEVFRLLAKCLQNGEDLLGHHRQHLDVDTVELVKTPPCSGLGEKEIGEGKNYCGTVHTLYTCSRNNMRAGVYTVHGVSGACAIHST